ncbi:MAG: hypothetical protein ACK5TQ_07130, partial [Acetobacteraceae bacterium]
LPPPTPTAARRGIDVLEAVRGALSALSANLLRSILTAIGSVTEIISGDITEGVAVIIGQERAGAAPASGIRRLF